MIIGNCLNIEIINVSNELRVKRYNHPQINEKYEGFKSC